MTVLGSGQPPGDPALARARAAARAGDLARAEAMCVEYLRGHSDSPEGHLLLGRVLSARGRPQEAIAHFRRAVELAPSNARCVAALAGQLERVREYASALEVRERLRSLEPDNVEHIVDIAALEEMLGRYDDAMRSVERALEREPAHAKARVFRVKIGLRASTPEPAELEAWRTTLAECARSGDPGARGAALDMLVDVCERLGDHAAAFEAMEEVNELDRTARPRLVPTAQRRKGYLTWTRELVQGISSERLAAWEEARPDDGLEAPALLVGFPRSGTTMTERALGAHRRIRSIEECPTFETIKRNLPRLVGARAMDSLPLGDVLEALTPEHLCELRRAYWERVGEAIGGVEDGDLVLDKMPLRIVELPFVCRVFPRTRLIVALRDPRDVCLSCFRQRFDVVKNTPMSFFLDLRDTARLYAHVMSLWLETRQAYPHWKEVRYEETVEDFEGRMREIIGFLGLEWDEAVLSFHERTGRDASTTPSYHAIRKRVYRTAVGRWRNYAPQLGPILPTLEPLVQALGYGQASGAR